MTGGALIDWWHLRLAMSSARPGLSAIWRGPLTYGNNTMNSMTVNTTGTPVSVLRPSHVSIVLSYAFLVWIILIDRTYASELCK